MFDNLCADILEARKVKVTRGWVDQHIKVFTQPWTIVVINYRYGRWARGVRVPIMGHVLWAIGLYVGFRRGIRVDISPEATIGPGFVVHTAHGVLVGAGTMGGTVWCSLVSL